jgi:hypothetical protein
MMFVTFRLLALAGLGEKLVHIQFQKAYAGLEMGLPFFMYISIGTRYFPYLSRSEDR